MGSNFLSDSETPIELTKKPFVDITIACKASTSINSERIEEYKNIIEQIEEINPNLQSNMSNTVSSLKSGAQNKIALEEKIDPASFLIPKNNVSKANSRRYNVDQEEIKKTKVEDEQHTPSAASTSQNSWLKKNESFIQLDVANGPIYQRLTAAIDKIQSTNSGRELLGAIEAICRFKSEEIKVHLSNSDEFPTSVLSIVEEDSYNSRGTGSYFFCNLDDIELNDDYVNAGFDRERLDAVIVYHELVHVLHNLQGESTVVQSAGINAELIVSKSVLFEEARTTGLGSFSRETVSENKFRKEIGVSPRTSYKYAPLFTINDDDTAEFYDNGKKVEQMFPYQGVRGVVE